MTPATPVSRRRRSPSRSWIPPATRISASYDRTRSRVRDRSGSAPPWLRTKRAHPRRDQLADQPVDRRRDRAAPRKGGQPLRPRVEPDREPVAGDREARAQVVRSVRDGRRRGPRAWHPPRRRAGSRHPIRRRRQAGAGPRSGPRSRRPPRGWPALRLVRRRSRRGGGAAPPSPRTAPRSGRAGRSAHRSRRRRRASRRDASGRPRGRSRGSPARTDQAPVVSSRRWKLIGSEPLRSSASWKPFRLNRSPSRRCSSSRRLSSNVRPSRYDSG